MRVVRSPVPSTTVLLGTIRQGETFRLPSHSGIDTVWMVTANSSNCPDRSRMVRTVSLVAGSVAYKNATEIVVPVNGRFVVDDWGQG